MSRSILIALTIFLFCNFTALAGERPNVILIITDDQGYGEIAAHGNPVIHTPALDQLHAESIRLTDFHVDPTCSPTRGALMTGKYSHRARVWHTVRGGNHLRASEVTMADVFRHNGYHTALFGKWHLGANYPYRPIDRGFEEWLGCGDGGTNTSDCYFWNDRVNDIYWHNGERVYREGFNPDVFFESAMNYVREYKSEDPFFIYLATYLPHKPYTFPSADFHKKYLDMGLSDQLAAYYASIEHVDGLVGKLRKVLKKTGQEKNTILIFMTDNGSTHGREAFNAGMNGGKGSTMDGGHRVPCFFHWPGGGLGNPRDIPQLCAHFDLLPTLTELCQMQLPRPVDFDGTTLVPLLKDKGKNWPDRTLVVEKQRSVEPNPSNSAIMTQQWRLVGHSKLFDIQKDPGQKHDIADQHPDVVSELLERFGKHWERVSPDHRSHPTPIAGTPHDKELLLSFSELRDGSGFAHGYAAAGREAKGIWHLEIAESGTYEFEVRRWPVEAEGPFQGVPEVDKTVDAWSPRGPKQDFLYGGGTLTPIPVHTVSLRVGDFFEKRDVTAVEKVFVFNVDLARGKTTVDAAFYDDVGKRLTNAYYVYVRKKRTS